MVRDIVVVGARQHNLKNIDVRIPGNALVVITGPSGSGKSSLAFDTLYAEGQRRYVEALSLDAKQILEQLEKPDVDSIEGICPAIAIEQRVWSRHPRSTVATVTELSDFLRLLFARVGTAHCPKCGEAVEAKSPQQALAEILSLPEGTRLQILAPVIRQQKGEHRKTLAELRKSGFVRVRIDGELRELDDPPTLARNTPHTVEVVIDRLVLRSGLEARLADSLELAYRCGGGLAEVEIFTPDGRHIQHSQIFSQRNACSRCDLVLPELTPALFSFNSPSGACSECKGLGTALHIDPQRLIDNEQLSVSEGAIRTWRAIGGKQFRMALLKALAERYGFAPQSPWQNLPEAARRAILFGTEEPLRIRIMRKGRARTFAVRFAGLVQHFERRLAEDRSGEVLSALKPYLTDLPCAHCDGARLRTEALAVKVGGKSIADIHRMTIRQALQFLSGLSFPPGQRAIAERVLHEILSRLQFLQELGVDYLQLNRPADSLSGGESQRLRLAAQLGASLSGILYVLDEPSVGLHPRDHTRLLRALLRLRDLGNTVVVVEHDRDTILAADHVIDLGPGAGVLGGQVVASGPPQDLLKHPTSLTAQYLSGRRCIPIPRERRKGPGWKLRLRGAAAHNLKSIDVEIPLGTMVCITGVSGAGKSSLAIDTLYRALAQRLHGSKDPPGPFAELAGWQFLDKVVVVDQSPIGRTPRSNPATYTGVFGPLREWFASLPEARARGYTAGRFSFNIPGGRCEACKGEGLVRVSMHFLPDVFVVCEACQGTRYNRPTLEVRYKGLNIAELLNLSVAQALEFLEHVLSLRQRLVTLCEVGLDYLPLGQPATTLSGGEAQRLKLARELCRRATGRTLYILDEPTAGLHFEDTRRLLDVLHRLVDAGNTVLVVEHNLDVIAAADYVIDVGPEGGEAGGQLVAVGSPEQIAATPGSFTGMFLRDPLERARQTQRLKLERTPGLLDGSAPER